MDAVEQSSALVEGRRVYLGNLLYIVRPIEIETTLAANGFEKFEKIHISIDPVNGRNPGYCFVDFIDCADAERALRELALRIRGRPVKIGPCEPKKPRERRSSNKPAQADQRWGNWTGQKDKPPRSTAVQGPYSAMSHFDESVLTDGDGRRVRIGGLKRMDNQVDCEHEIKLLLAGFSPAAIGKRITPHKSILQKGGHWHYCFVDFNTSEEASAVIKALNGKPHMGGRLLVQPANPIPKKLREPTRWLKDEETEEKDTTRCTRSAARPDPWSMESPPNPSRRQPPTRDQDEGAEPSVPKPSTSVQRPSWPQMKGGDQKSYVERSTGRNFRSGASDSSTSRSMQPSRSLASSN